MFFIRLLNGIPREISDTHPRRETDVWAKTPEDPTASGWISSRDFVSKSHADRLAKYLTAMTGDSYLGVDEGDGIWPRYRVVKAPKVGEEVSKSFNGDSYPCGKIVKITPTWQVTTDQGKKFLRWKESGGWREAGRGFWMISGVHDERNPHF